MLFKRIAINLILICMVASGAAAQTLSKPANKPILVISGSIQNTNKDKTAEFDREMLMALGLQLVETTNPWYDGKTRFEGVHLDQLMKLVGAKGTTIRIVALNDYVTTIPLDDFKKFKVILAMKRDGNFITVREKGPLFIIYPYDSDPQLKSQTYYTRSAWQVSEIIVE